MQGHLGPMGVAGEPGISGYGVRDSCGIYQCCCPYFLSVLFMFNVYDTLPGL